jgi:hypothetical protein
MIQRNGLVIIRILENVQRVTIEPIIRHFVKKGSNVHTDEYNICNCAIGHQYLTITTLLIIVKANTLVMEMVNMKIMLIQWRASVLVFVNTLG